MAILLEWPFYSNFKLKMCVCVGVCVGVLVSVVGVGVSVCVVFFVLKTFLTGAARCTRDLVLDWRFWPPSEVEGTSGSTAGSEVSRARLAAAFRSFCVGSNGAGLR